MDIYSLRSEYFINHVQKEMIKEEIEGFFSLYCIEPSKKGKVDKKEKIARKALVKVWTEILEEFARPGAELPSMHEIRRILLKEGVKAAVAAVKKEYWYIPESTIKAEIKKKVEEGLNDPELELFIGEVRAAQFDPGLLPALKEHIRSYLLDY